MKIRKKAVAAVMAATLCTSLTGCGANDKTMWEALETSGKKEYNYANVTIAMDSSDDLVEEFGMSAEALGLDHLNHMELTLKTTQQDLKTVACVFNGSINDQEETALGEMRFIDDTYYFNVAPLASLLGESDNAYMKVIGALLPTDEWIQFSMDDMKEYIDSEAAEIQSSMSKDIKDQKKLALSLSDTFVTLLEELCGNDYVTKENNRFTLTLNQDDVNAIVEKAIMMERDDKALTKAVEAVYEAFDKYGNESMAESLSSTKEEALNMFAEIADPSFVPEKITDEGSMSVYIESKKSNTLMGFGFKAEGVTVSYDIEAGKNGKPEIKVPEKTISMKEFIETLNQF